MSKRKMPGAYGFSAKAGKSFVPRVAKEAKPHDKFLVVGVKNVDPIKRSAKLIVLADTSSLPPKAAGFVLAGSPLQKNWGKKLEGTRFRLCEQKVKDMRKAMNVAHSEIQKVQNFLQGKTLRVQVLAIS